MKLISDAMVEKGFVQALEGLRYGSLTLTTPAGKDYTFTGREAGPHATFKLANWGVMKNAMMRGDIALGEDYIAGLWETDSIENLFAVFMLNMDELDSYAHGDWLRRLGFLLYNRVICRNSKKGSSANIQAHYDVGNDFYKLWLDETMTYSSAIYHTPEQELAEAQRAKYGRILSRVGDADSVLEVGCGWGGFAEEAVKDSRKLTGITISPSQHAFATERLGGAADIRLQDYRELDGKFDAIVSIEMFEAVGERYWKQYFRTLSEKLKRGGKAVVQTIT
ncbi:MAG: cyclopropane-fatty-acyl-phospholipid synthase family protein, partial [Rickettsiales bacterium]|nr:cyclopropane-fatty-acyl-phospholipid synthase family protein [Rickettsiales bacterium]